MARQPSYRELFRVGDVVEIAQAPLDGESDPQWLRGKVIKISTRLHVSHGGPGHMAYERADYNKGLIRAVAVSASPKPSYVGEIVDDFHVGDRVEAGKDGTEEYDVGTVVVVRNDTLRIYWERAEQLMDEETAAVRRAT